MGKAKLKAGEWVEVRSREEILATLDANGRLDELPFMPQMLQYCGQRFRVRKRAHKLCDTAHSTGGRQMADAALLENVNCDGQAYGGCEMACQIFWKEAWLKRVDPERTSNALVGKESGRAGHQGALRCSEADIWAGTRASTGETATAEPLYVCQATQMLRATQPLSRWNLRQYFEDCESGNITLSQILSGLLFVAYSNLAESGLGIGSALRWTYDTFQKIRGGTCYPARRGLLSKGSRTPSLKLGIQVGELVRVREYPEILKTVDEGLINRGMSFHPEMVPYCGKTFRVAQRLRKIMNERTGQLMELKNECLVLSGADCVGRYANPVGCPRASNPYWREIWLDRVDPSEASAVSAQPRQGT